MTDFCNRWYIFKFEITAAMELTATDKSKMINCVVHSCSAEMLFAGKKSYSRKKLSPWQYRTLDHKESRVPKHMLWTVGEGSEKTLWPQGNLSPSCRNQSIHWKESILNEAPMFMPMMKSWLFEKILWCWEMTEAREEKRRDRGWDGWMVVAQSRSLMVIQVIVK